MKKLLLLIVLLSVVLDAKPVTIVNSIKETNAEKYNYIFEQISKKRVGPSDRELGKVANPFVKSSVLSIIKGKKLAPKHKPIVLKLYGIIDNKANINKKWYKLKSKIYGYRLVKIKNISVVLKRKRRKLELFLRKKNDKIKISKSF